MTQQSELIFSEKQALLLAGKLSMAASKLINGNLSSLSGNLNELSQARDEYDNYIFNHPIKVGRRIG